MEHTNGGDKLDKEQLEQFEILQDAFYGHELWVGWNDCNPDTADELTVTDDAEDGSGDAMDGADDCLDYVLDGSGDPEELALQYVDILRPVEA